MFPTCASPYSSLFYSPIAKASSSLDLATSMEPSASPCLPFQTDRLWTLFAWFALQLVTPGLFIRVLSMHAAPKSAAMSCPPCPPERYGITASQADPNCTDACPEGSYCPAASIRPTLCSYSLYPGSRSMCVLSARKRIGLLGLGTCLESSGRARPANKQTNTRIDRTVNKQRTIAMKVKL